MDKLKLFVPTQEKLDKIAEWLMNGYLVSSDEFRNPDHIWNVTIPSNFFGRGSLFYELPEYGGVFGFRDIIPGFKAHVVFKIWSPEVWTHGLVKESKDLMSKVIEIYELKRLSSQTADERIVRISEIVGFKVDGVLKNAFMWNGELFDMSLLGMTGG